MYTFRTYLFVAITVLLVQHTSKPMSLRRAAMTRAKPTRTTSTAARPPQRTYLRGMNSMRRPESESAAASQPQMTYTTTQATVRPTRTWGQWFAGLFGRPRVQKPELLSDKQVAMNQQYILEQAKIRDLKAQISKEQYATLEQSKINAFKQAMIAAPSHSDIGIFDTDDIEVINKREKLIEENPDFINLSIAFKDTWRGKGRPHHAITILHQLLRTLVKGYYTDKKHMLIEEYNLWYRKPEVWQAEIALTKKVFRLGGKLGDNPQEALFETLKRKAAIEELFPTIYTQYFENDINNILRAIAAAHNLDYDRLEKDAHAAVADYIFKEKNRKAEAYNAMKNLLGMNEVPTTWKPISNALKERGIIRKPIKKSEFIRKDLGLGPQVMDDEAAKIIRHFRWTHLYDKKYNELNSIIALLFEEQLIGGEFQTLDYFIKSASPKLLEAPYAEEYRVLGVNAQTSWKEIATQYEKLLDQNDPTYETDPMKRYEKEATSEEIMHAFKILEADRIKRAQQRFHELEQQERQRYQREEL